MKTLNGNKTHKDLLATCDEALRQYKAGDRTPEIGGVVFDGAAFVGRCQQNVREAVEATAYGRERMWGEASCCATATHQRLKGHSWPSRSLGGAYPGDVVYLGPGGGRCDICRQDPGHVGILHHQADGGWYLWQNTVYNGLGLCLIRLRPEQQARIVGIYRLFPLGASGPAVYHGERPVNWHGSYLKPDDVLFEGGEHFVNLRAAAAAEGSIVKVDPVSGKVFVGPKEWWD